jgi:hypothetical protein
MVYERAPAAVATSPVVGRLLAAGADCVAVAIADEFFYSCASLPSRVRRAGGLRGRRALC